MAMVVPTVPHRSVAAAMNHSADVDQLAAALLAIQSEGVKVEKNHENTFFRSKYADLASVMKAAAPIVTQHGVSVCQLTDFDGTHDLLTTIVMHTSGQWVEASMRLHLVKDDPQGQGSALTYARRYAYMAALGLVADEDDDGNAASKAKKSRPQPKTIEHPGPPAALTSPPKRWTPEEIAKAKAEAAAKAQATVPDGEPF